MSDIDAEALLQMSKDEQEQWVRQQDWHQDDAFEQMLYDEKPIAILYPDLEENLEERVRNFDAYNNIGLVDDGHFSTDRIEQLENGEIFSSEDLKRLRSAIIDQMFGDFDVEMVKCLDMQVGKSRLNAIFSGLDHPQAGYCPHFVGIFRTGEEALEVLAQRGYVDDDVSWLS